MKDMISVVFILIVVFILFMYERWTDNDKREKRKEKIYNKVKNIYY